MQLNKVIYSFIFLTIWANVSAQDVLVIEKKADRIRFQVCADIPAIQHFSQNDSLRTLLSVAGWPLFEHANGAVLPYKPILLHLDSPAASVRILSVQERRVPLRKPVSFAESAIGDPAVAAAQQMALFHPLSPELVTVDYLGQYRQNHLLRADVFPYHFDVQTNELIIYSTILFDVVGVAHDSPRQPMPISEGEFLRHMGVTSSVQTQKARTVSPALAKRAAVSNERWKIYVNQDGLYRITGRDLAEAGVRLLDIDFKKLRLTCNGRDVSLYAEGWRDGQFHADDFFEFWGEANQKTFQSRASDLYQDPYSDNRVYWLSWEKRGLWMVEESGEISAVQPGQSIRPYSFLQTVHMEEDNYYDHLSHVPIDTLRDHWFYDRGILAGKKVDYAFDLWHPDNQSPLRVTARVMLSGSTTIVGSAHDVSLYLNNSFVASHRWTMQDLADLASADDSYINGADIRNGENVLSIVNNVNPQNVDNILLNWFEITYPRLYRAHNDYIRFKIPPDYQGGNFLFRVDGFQDANVHVYKIHQSKIVGGQVEQVIDLQNQTSLQISFQNDVLSPETEFVAVSNSAKHVANKIEKDAPSSLMDIGMAANYVIIAHKKFIHSPSVAKLVELRRAQGHTPLVVDVQDVYDEFSYGHVSSYAIRDFLKWAYEQWQAPRLQHVFLIGDGCYLQVSATGDTLDYIPVHMRQTMNFGSAASDFWYALVSGDDEVPDINIGRLPVKTVQELEAALDKVIQYETSPPQGDWPNRFLIIGGNGITFRSQGIALSKIMPPDFDTQLLFSVKDKSIDYDPYFGGTSDLLDYLDQGCSVITFHGHGGGAIWADNSLLRLEDVSRFYTQGKLPFILSMTCYTGAFEDPNREQSLADALLFTESEGALAMVGASGVGWEWNDYFLQTEILKQIFNNPGMTLGDMITGGKISYLAHYKTPQAVSQINQYHLLGDPATRIVLPEHQTTLEVDDPILLKGEAVNASTVLPFAQGVGYFSIHDSTLSATANAPVPFSNGNPGALLPISDEFAGESGIIRFYGADNFGGNRTHGSLAISLKGAVFDSAFVSPTLEDSLYFFVHIRSRSPLANVWCLALNDSLPMQQTSDNWFKSSRAVKVAWTGFQFSYYFVAVDEENTVYNSRLYKHYIGYNVDVAIDQQDLVFTGQEQVYLEATIHNASSDAVAHLPILYEFRDGDAGWHKIGCDTVAVDAYASFKSRYPYAPEPGPLTLRITLDPDSTLREDNRENNVLITTVSPTLFQCTSTGFLLNGKRANSLMFDETLTIELPAGALSGHAALLVDTLQQVKISQQPDYLYVSNTPAYDVHLMAPVRLDKAATVIFHLPADSSTIDSVAKASHLFRFSKQTKKWIRCDTQSLPSTLYAELPDMGPLALLTVTDSTPPQVSLTIDGQPFVTGKWASDEPRIGLRLQDVNGVDISTGRLDIVLNGKSVDATELALPDSIVDGNQILISYNPELQAGEQLLTARASDCNQNMSEQYEFSFRVASEFDIQMLGNYPNPFVQDTRFVYIFTSPVSDMSLKLFTASGRLIRHFTATDVPDDPNPLGADYHEIYWDGADVDGFEVANGVYFYQLIGKSSGTTKTVTGKIAKIK
ncbi:hypothetical protein JXA02_01800 [candidate division KSB1 bacterium]|nr:hypothetical protein [candidate division KSB1 bacterium]RQW10717.1 MAG: hypothetical protein EH222_01995 [candidate division KSB1 bacterium]